MTVEPTDPASAARDAETHSQPRRNPKPKGWLRYLMSALILGGLSLGPRGVTVTLTNETGERLGPVSVRCLGDAAFANWIEPGGTRSLEVCASSDSSIWVGFGPYPDADERVVDLGTYTCSGWTGSVEASVVGPLDSGPHFANVLVTSEPFYSLWTFLPSDRFARGFGTALAFALLWVAGLRLWGSRARGS